MNFSRVSDATRRDLDDIWLYIAQDNPDAADRFLRRLVSTISTLASMPHLGQRREELSPNLRSFPVGNYVIFYRPIQNGVEIVRALHGARGLPPFFE